VKSDRPAAARPRGHQPPLSTSVAPMPGIAMILPKDVVLIHPQ
jgi:hypothetical protein